MRFARALIERENARQLSLFDECEAGSKAIEGGSLLLEGR